MPFYNYLKEKDLLFIKEILRKKVEERRFCLCLWMVLEMMKKKASPLPLKSSCVCPILKCNHGIMPLLSRAFCHLTLKYMLCEELRDSVPKADTMEYIKHRQGKLCVLILKYAIIFSSTCTIYMFS